MSYIQKFKQAADGDNVNHHLKLTFNKKLLFILAITLSIPLTVFMSSQEQNLKKEAAQINAPVTKGYIIEFKDKPITAQRNADISSERTPQDRRKDIDAQHILIKNDILTILGKGGYSTNPNPGSVNNVSVQGEYVNVFNGISLNITQAEAEKIKNESPYVKAVYPNYEVKESLMNSVPLINADKVWLLRDSTQSTITGKKINIAILDTGVDYKHQDLGRSSGAQIFNSKVTGGYDFINDDNNPIDDRGHGTHVAAIAGGNGALKGVAPGANIIAYKVLDGGGSGSFATILSGIDAAVGTHYDSNNSNDVSVINLSLGAYCGTTYTSTCGPDDVLSQGVDSATTEGIVSIVAAGNTGPSPSTVTTPATARTAIAVGSINKSKIISSFSAHGPVTYSNQIFQKPDVVAPGEAICAARFSGLTGQNCLDNDHVLLSGTSMASPHVAGMAALIKQQNPSLNASDIKYLITQNASNLGYDINTQGKGMVDAANIFDFSSPQPSSTPIPQPSSTPIPTPTPAPTKTTTITSYQDSYVKSDQTGTNFGTSTRLRIGTSPKEIAYLKFDLSSLNGKKIISANLKLTIATTDGSGSTEKFSIRKVDLSDWTEGTVKYSNRPDLSGTVTSFTGKGTGSVIEVNIKSLVEQVAGSKTSFAIATDGANELILISSEASSNRPQIVVQYQ